MVVFQELEYLERCNNGHYCYPKKITKENFAKFGDLITTENIKPTSINDGYAKRFDGIVNLDTLKGNGETTISIFAAIKRTFPMNIDMMEQHPLGSQAFIPMKETTFYLLWRLILTNLI